MEEKRDGFENRDGFGDNDSGSNPESEGAAEDNSRGNLNYIFDGEGGQKQYQRPDASFGGNPYNSYYRPPRISSFSKIFVSAALAIVMFVSGFLLAYYVVPSEEEKLARFIREVSDKYFYDVDGSGVSFIDNMGYAMVKSLDEYSSFYSGDSLQKLYEEREGKFNDTGLVLDVVEGECRVLKVYGGSPAYNAGIRAGDVLEKVNDYQTAGKSLSDIRGKIFEARDIGQDVAFHFKRYLGEQTEDYVVNNLTSAEYNPVFSYYYDSDNEIESKRIPSLPQDTAYITLEEFSHGADEQFKANLDTFREKGKKHLILDMRTNFGGSLDVLRSIASYLITDAAGSAQVLITKAEFKDKSTVEYHTTGNYYRDYFAEDSKIMVLANGRSASATEVLICAMKDYATIHKLVGEPTFGKAVMQGYFEYNNRYGVYVTIALLYSPVTNQTYNKTADKNYGFWPDVKVDYQKAGDFAYDVQLAAAISALTSAE